MRRDAFADCHPAVNFLFFAAVIGMGMFLNHPVCQGLSLVCALTYLIRLRGGALAMRQVGYLLPVLLGMSLLNPLFNHEGVTVLFYLPNDNPVTLEAICFGINASVTMGASILWFNCCNAVFTSDKIIYLFGRMIPAMSLMISMTLRFVPRFKNHLQSVLQAQRAMSKREGKLAALRLALTSFSATVSWAMEQSIVCADSMKSRGYGLGGRTAFSIYRFDRRDALVLTLTVVLAMGVILCAVTGTLRWAFYPRITGTVLGPGQLAAYFLFGGVCLMPLTLDALEDRVWNSLQSNI